ERTGVDGRLGAGTHGATGGGDVVSRTRERRERREPVPSGPGSILVVGSVALDSVRTPFGAAEEALGGSASYFSISASHFAPVCIIAVVGEDFPPEHRALFESRGIDLSGLETALGRTFRWRGEYSVELGHAHTL